ncbi:MAG TPA: hypothetical protein VFZ81_12755, partial [Burkholderiales bacterium]
MKKRFFGAASYDSLLFDFARSRRRKIRAGWPRAFRYSLDSMQQAVDRGRSTGSGERRLSLAEVL